MSMGFLFYSMSVHLKIIDGEEMTNKRYFIDIYDYALIQQYAYKLDGLSFWIMGIYTLKFSQFNDSIATFFATLKKSMLEILFLLFAFFSMLLTLAFTFTYMYGPNIGDYSTLRQAFFTIVRVFLFIEYASATTKLLDVDLFSSLAILFITMLGLRIFFFNLINPIFIEYFRNENDQNFLTKKEGKFYEVPFLSKLKFLINPYREESKEDQAFVPPPEEPDDTMDNEK